MKRQTLILIVCSFVLIAVVFGIVAYNKPHRSVAREEAAFRLSAPELAEAFATDEALATNQYAGEVVEVHGNVREVIPGDSTLILMLEPGSALNGVSCYLDADQWEHAQLLPPGAPVVIKGICNGMLLDVVIDKAIVIEHD